MSDGVKLLFGVHAHQPAGNFPEVVRDAAQRCYVPFLDVLERHPDFPFAIHVSGWLTEFLAREFPDAVARLRRMVDRRQAEVFGGGDTEPVLAALPDADRHGQLLAMNERIRRRFGVRPRGAWLTERVWEATIVPALVDCGIEYVAVDDYHFTCAGESRERLDSHFTTEEDGRRLDLFPISETLRYKFPFAPASEAIAHLEGLAVGGAAIYFDDIEKFGIWPETYDWVYGRRWLEDFIEGVARSPRIEPVRFDDYHAATKTRGIVYLPAVSYIEMGEWALPARSARRYAQLIERAKHENTFELDRPFLRGGHWRNFFSRYPESNWMHKRMESASRRMHALAPAARSKAMRTHLHLAQANDAYWHGLFGGIYLPHLRRQVFASLARLETALDRRAPRKPLERVDVDGDGDVEVLLWSPRMLVAVKPAQGASVCELTHYRLAHNFSDTLRRREEHYYEKVRARPATSERSTPASIHDRIAFRSEIADEDLVPDTHPRALFVDFWQPEGGQPTLLHYAPSAARRSVARGAAAAFASANGGIDVTKRFKIEAKGLVVAYEMFSAAGARGTMTVELNVSMPSCDGPGGAYVADGKRLGGFGQAVTLEACRELRLEDTELPGALRVLFSEPARLDAQPFLTVSQSEAGFEKIMQAATLRAGWAVSLDPGASRTIVVRLMVRS